jgi:hypothetical protein
MTNPGGSGAARWLPLAKHVGWPASTWNYLIYVINRESGGRPNALNASTNCQGLLQCMKRYAPPGANLFDATTNLTVGLRWWRQGGWTPWRLY